MKYHKHKTIVEGVISAISEFDEVKYNYNVLQRADDDGEIVLTREREAGAPIDTSAVDLRIITVLNAIGYRCTVYNGEIEVGGSADE